MTWSLVRSAGLGIAILILLAPATGPAAYAQTNVGRIGAYADPAGMDCNIVDVENGLVMVYIVHTNAEEASMSLFKLEPDPGVQLAFIGEVVSAPFLYIGSALDGIRIYYQDCQTDFPLLLITMTTFGTGASSACAPLRFVSHQNAQSGTVEVTDCSDQIHADIPTDDGLVSTDGGCECTPPVAAEPSTWGRIKSMYG